VNAPVAPGTAISVDDRGLPLLSPSGAQTWRRCNRRFGWRYLDGFREPEGSGARLGKAYHAAMERYLLGTLRGADDLERADYPELTPEQWTTLRRIVKAALASGAYPEPRPGVVVAIERDLSLACANASWRGRVDAILTRPDRRLVVLDHKSTRDLEYALTDETLPTDPQGVFYPAALTHPGLDSAPIDLEWIYVQTHGAARVSTARATVTPTEADERMRMLDADVGSSVRDLLVQRPRVLDLEPSWDQCDAFGGCPHRERCGERPILAALSAALDHARALTRTGEPVQQQHLQQQIALPTFAEKYGPPQAAPAPQYVQQPQSAPASQASPSAPAPSGPPAGLQAIFQGAPAPAPAQWTPPVAPSQPAPSAPPQPAPGPYASDVNRPDGPSTNYPDLQAAAAPAQHALAAPQPAQTFAQTAQPQPAQAFVQPQAQPQPQPAPVQAQAQPQPSVAFGFCLLVGGVAVGVLPFRRVIPIEHVIARATSVLRERQGVQDYRLVEYGGGPGLLLLHVQAALIEAQVGEGDAIVVSQVGPEWQVLGSALRAQAAGVFQAVTG
jgi:RecB family exonuclease